jgi:hypothetical protein
MLADYSMVNVAFVDRLFGKDVWKKDLKKKSPTLLNARGDPINVEGTLDVKVAGDDGKLDLQVKLGITSGNVPKGIMASVVETDEVTDLIDLKLNLADAIGQLKLAKKKDSNYSSLLYTYRLRVQENIKDLIDINKNLKGSYTHPDGVIKFNTSDDEPVNVSTSIRTSVCTSRNC